MNKYKDEDRILKACADPNRKTISAPDPDFDFYSARQSEAIIRYDAKTVVKFGRWVTREAYKAQDLAYRILDRSIVRVPKVYHFFSRGETRDDWCGYLVMEYIKGQQCPKRPTEEQFQKVGAALNHLQTYHCDVPGPIGGGPTLWGLFCYEEVEITTLEDLETFVNDLIFFPNSTIIRKPRFWRQTSQTRVKFSTDRLVLTHCDIRHDNIMFDARGNVVLLDWKAAGFYPRTFERATLVRNFYRAGDEDDEELLPRGVLHWQEIFHNEAKKFLELSEEEEIEEWKVIHAINLNY